jgi:hypothetical protein
VTNIFTDPLPGALQVRIDGWDTVSYSEHNR